MSHTGLAHLLAAAARPAAAPVRLRRAQVVTWDAGSGYVISLAGADVTVTAMLSPAAGTIAAGDVVAAAVWGSTILVLGKIVSPS